MEMISRKFNPVISLKRQRQYLIVFFSLLGFIISITQVFGLSRDYFNYAEFFDMVRKSQLDIFVSSRFEPGFIIFSLIFVKILNSNITVYSCFVVIAMLLKGWVINYYSVSHKIFFVAAVFYFARYFPLHELTQLRLAIGIGLILVAAIFYWEKNALAGTLVCAAALLFHVSVAAIIPAIFLYSSKRWRVIVTGIITLFLVSIFTAFVTKYISGYIQIINDYESNNVFRELKPNPYAAYLILDWSMIIVSLIFWKRISFTMKRIVFLQVIGLAIFYGAIDFSVTAIRIRELYSVFWIVFIVEGLKKRNMIFITNLFVIGNIIFYTYLYFFFKEIPFFLKV